MWRSQISSILRHRKRLHPPPAIACNLAPRLLLICGSLLSRSILRLQASPSMKTILFADDNKNIREYCRAVFEDEGYRVVLARDGIEAFRLFCAETPDVAVLDISMPRAGGLAALQEIKGVRPETPVILFTAHDEDCLQDQRTTLAAACVEKMRGSGRAETGRCLGPQNATFRNPGWAPAIGVTAAAGQSRVFPSRDFSCHPLSQGRYLWFASNPTSGCQKRIAIHSCSGSVKTLTD